LYHESLTRARLFFLQVHGDVEPTGLPALLHHPVSHLPALTSLHPHHPPQVGGGGVSSSEQPPRLRLSQRCSRWHDFNAQLMTKDTDAKVAAIQEAFPEICASILEFEGHLQVGEFQLTWRLQR
jgi:hypothetical protein